MRINPIIEGLDEILETEIAELKVLGQAAMAKRFAKIVNHNFGESGEDRPTPWEYLSWSYANRFHGGDVTPKLILSGELQNSIQIQDTEFVYSEVFTELDYALTMQFGGESHEYVIPARPFFPILNSSPEDSETELTPYAQEQILKSAEDAINQKLDSSA